jgi:hypothetical protein
MVPIDSAIKAYHTKGGVLFWGTLSAIMQANLLDRRVAGLLLSNQQLPGVTYKGKKHENTFYCPVAWWAGVSSTRFRRN